MSCGRRSPTGSGSGSTSRRSGTSPRARRGRSAVARRSPPIPPAFARRMGGRAGTSWPRGSRTRASAMGAVVACRDRALPCDRAARRDGLGRVEPPRRRHDPRVREGARRPRRTDRRSSRTTSSRRQALALGHRLAVDPFEPSHGDRRAAPPAASSTTRSRQSRRKKNAGPGEAGLDAAARGARGAARHRRAGRRHGPCPRRAVASPIASSAARSAAATARSSRSGAASTRGTGSPRRRDRDVAFDATVRAAAARAGRRAQRSPSAKRTCAARCVSTGFAVRGLLRRRQLATRSTPTGSSRR